MLQKNLSKSLALLGATALLSLSGCRREVKDKPQQEATKLPTTTVSFDLQGGDNDDLRAGYYEFGPNMGLSAASDFTTIAYLIDKNNGEKATAEFKFTASGDENNVSLAYSGDLTLTSLSGTAVSLDPSEEWYICGIAGGGTYLDSESPTKVSFAPAGTDPSDGHQLRRPLWAPWVKLEITATNKVHGKLSFKPLGSAFLISVQRNNDLQGTNRSYTFSSNVVDNNGYFDFNSVSKDNFQSMTTPTWAFSHDGDFKQTYNADRNIATDATTEDKWIVWGMSRTGVTNPYTTVTTSDGGYVLIRADKGEGSSLSFKDLEIDPETNQPKLAAYNLYSTVASFDNGKYYTLSLKAMGTAHLNPLSLFAERNVGTSAKTWAGTWSKESGLAQWTNVASEETTLGGTAGTYLPGTAGKWQIPTGQMMLYAFPTYVEESGAFPANPRSLGLWYEITLANLQSSYTTGRKETIKLIGQDYTVKSYYKGFSSEADRKNKIYAIRFAEHDKVGNLLRCAYRYEFIKTVSNETDNAYNVLKVTSRYIGDTPVTLDAVSEEGFWAANNAFDVVREFPLTGRTGSSEAVWTRRNQSIAYWMVDWYNVSASPNQKGTLLFSMEDGMQTGRLSKDDKMPIRPVLKYNGSVENNYDWSAETYPASTH